MEGCDSQAQGRPVTPGAMKQDRLWDWRMEMHRQVWIGSMCIVSAISETVPERG